MKLNFYIILLLLLSFAVKADQILELIKIPNLTLHKLENKNSLAFLKPTKDFFVGSSSENVSCKKNQSQNFNEKYLKAQKVFNKYNDDFFRKIKLKFIVLCSELEIAGIPALGFANPEMKTLILNTNSNNLNLFNALSTMLSTRQADMIRATAFDYTVQATASSDYRPSPPYLSLASSRSGSPRARPCLSALRHTICSTVVRRTRHSHSRHASSHVRSRSRH